jgi:hypothetical protein
VHMCPRHVGGSSAAAATKAALESLAQDEKSRRDRAMQAVRKCPEARLRSFFGTLSK